MYTKFLILLFVAFTHQALSQNSTDRVPISETFSSNGKFWLESISYDSEFPNLKGESKVSYSYLNNGTEAGKNYYEINRSFDLYDGYPYFAALSNDGRKIIYIKDMVYSKGDEQKDVTYYVDGKLQKTYTTEEFINCDRSKEKCGMFYNNQNEMYTAVRYSYKQFRNKVTEDDKFLIKNYVFNKNDTIYLVDARKKVTIYDLDKDRFIGRNIDFDSVYPQIRGIEAVKSSISYYVYPYKWIIDIESVKSSEKLSETISKTSNLKFVHVNDEDFFKYKLYRISLSGYLNRDGKLEIENFEADKIFDKDKIETYLENTVFKTEFIPKEVNKIYVKNFYGGYRNFDDKIAEEETQKEKERAQEEAKKRLTLEKIGDVYIPKNLHECLTELDKIVDFEGKKQVLDPKDAWQLNSHMGGLGMWIRNNWGINGGSRLSKYFHDRNIGTGTSGNDEISGVIITQYIKWLKGDNKSWKEWEKEYPIKQ
ncbi:MAG: DUF6794 domain-containing protein [Pedobacter sp.]